MILELVRITRNSVYFRRGITDPGISLMATGVLGYCLSREHERVTLEELLKDKPLDSHGSILAAVHELQAAGYIKEAK